MSAGISLALVLVAAFLASPAAAARLPDPRIPSWEVSNFEEANSSVWALYRLAVCVRDERGSASEAYLRTSPGSPEERAALPLIPPPGKDKCLTRTDRLVIRNHNLLRGAIAEAFYNGSAARPRYPAALPEAVEAAMPQSDAMAPAQRVGRVVGACSARRSPMLAHTALQFNPGGIGELRALKALGPTFLSCLPAGTSLRVSRLSIRASLAEALYHAWRTYPALFSARPADA